MPDEAIERFQQQMEIVSMIDIEDAAAIQSKVKECIEKDPGAVDSETMIIELEDDEEEEDIGEVMVVDENVESTFFNRLIGYLVSIEINT